MNSPTLSIRLLIYSLMMWTCAAGCRGGSNAPTTSAAEATVKGSVIVAGKPLAGGKVVFEVATGPREALIGKDGKYSLTTTVGNNAVSLRVPEGFKSSTVANYMSSCPVTEGQENELNINLASKGREK